jgi:hypothetical protein
MNYSVYRKKHFETPATDSCFNGNQILFVKLQYCDALITCKFLFLQNHY